jgi:hypothetical protein
VKYEREKVRRQQNRAQMTPHASFKFGPYFVVGTVSIQVSFFRLLLLTNVLTLKSYMWIRNQKKNGDNENGPSPAPILTKTIYPENRPFTQPIPISTKPRPLRRPQKNARLHHQPPFSTKTGRLDNSCPFKNWYLVSKVLLSWASGLLSESSTSTVTVLVNYRCNRLKYI